MLDRPNNEPNFDTQWVVDRLTQGGWSEGQARALCEVLREAQRGLATKADIENLQIRIEALESKMEALEAKMEALESKMVVRMAALEARMESIERNARWDRGFMAAGFALLAFLILFKDFLIG